MSRDVPSLDSKAATGTGRARPTPRQPSTVVDPATDPSWEALVTERRSDVFHSPAWMRVLRQTYDLQLRAHVLRGPAGDAEAGFAFAPVDDLLGLRNISLPFSDFCDPLVDEHHQWTALTEGVIGHAHTTTLKVLYDHVAELDARLAEHSRSKWHRADTTIDVDAMWSRLDSAARRAIRKSEASGTRVAWGESLRDMRKFFDLHLRVRKVKYGLLAQPWSFFEALWDQFVSKGDGCLIMAEHDGRIISGVLFLRWKDTLYYKLNASDQNVLALRPNDAVLWAGMQYAHAEALQWLDFGISALDQEGLIRYKRKYATEEGHVRVLRTTPSRPDQRTEDVRRLLPQLTDLFVRPDVPDEVTRRAGDLLYRYFV